MAHNTITAKTKENLKAHIMLIGSDQWKEAGEKLPFITLSREFGCQGYPLANDLQLKLNKMGDEKFPWMVFDRELINRLAGEHNWSLSLLESFSESCRSQIRQSIEALFFKRPNDYTIFHSLAGAIISLAEKGHTILVGRGGCIITGKIEKGLHVRLLAPFNFRVANIKKVRNIPSWKEAELLVKRMEKERETFVKAFTLESVSGLCHFDLIINNEKFTVNEMSDLIIKALQIKKLLD